MHDDDSSWEYHHHHYPFVSALHTLQFIKILPRSMKKARSQCDFNSSHFLLSAKNPLCYWSRVRCSRGLQRSALLTALAGGDYPTIQRHGHQPHASARTVTLTRVWSLACLTVPHQTQLPSGPEGHWPQLPQPWPLNWFLLQNKACFIQRRSHSIKVMPWHRYCPTRLLERIQHPR